jgi:hypothetical protein
MRVSCSGDGHVPVQGRAPKTATDASTMWMRTGSDTCSTAIWYEFGIGLSAGTILLWANGARRIATRTGSSRTVIQVQPLINLAITMLLRMVVAVN